MPKIITKENCGNAPKQKFILDFLTALANMEVEKAMDMLSEDAQLEIVGQKVYSGKEKIKDIIIKDGARSKLKKLEIATIISHGKICAANGVMDFKDGSNVAFNNMYTFSSHGKNAKLKEIKTYALVLA